ncbi:MULTISPECIES: Pr6Pr family membrane protein [unclassified Microbacterium]|uniref:Pr6Pr family membrane protein n=1 Tax=unclassified Microbacterium TaxID=2609290 RepID=UPI0037467889
MSDDPTRPTTSRRPAGETVWAVLRLILAALIIAAVIAQGAVSIGGAAAQGRDTATTAVNFFSFFTILSNLAAAAVLLWATVRWVSGRAPRTDGVAFATTLAAVTTYMIVTGIVYNTLLRNIPLPQGSTVPWSNEVLHLVAPLFLLLDVFLGPGRRALRWRAIGQTLIFPIAWVAYTLIRGPLTTDPSGSPDWWYPYPFLNPNTLPGGYPAVAAYVAGIAVVIALVATGVVAVSRRRGAHVDAGVSRRRGIRPGA